MLKISVILNEHLQGATLQVLSPWTSVIKIAKKVIAIIGIVAAMAIIIICRYIYINSV